MTLWDWLFSMEGFVTRDQCGYGWTKELQHHYQVANLLVQLAYLIIPVSFAIALMKYKQDGAWGTVFDTIIWIAFFFFCGGGHTLEALTFYWANYRFHIVWYDIQAIVALIGAARTYATVMQLRKRLTPPQTMRLIKRTLAAEKKLKTFVPNYKYVEEN